MKARLLAWTCAGLVVTLTVVVSVVALSEGVGEPYDIVWGTLPVLFAGTALLILNKQADHAVGWVMMVLAVGGSVSGAADAFVATMEGPPETLTFLTWLSLGFNNFGWVFLIYPLFHLLLVFPTGRLLSPRWRFFVVLEVVMVSIMVIASLFNEQIGPLDGPWVVPNPVGFVPTDFFGDTFFAWWGSGLFVMAIGGLASVVVRFVDGRRFQKRRLAESASTHVEERRGVKTE